MCIWSCQRPSPLHRTIPQNTVTLAYHKPLCCPLARRFHPQQTPSPTKAPIKLTVYIARRGDFHQGVIVPVQMKKTVKVVVKRLQACQEASTRTPRNCLLTTHTGKHACSHAHITLTRLVTAYTPHIKPPWPPHRSDTAEHRDTHTATHNTSCSSSFYPVPPSPPNTH